MPQIQKFTIEKVPTIKFCVNVVAEVDHSSINIHLISRSKAHQYVIVKFACVVLIESTVRRGAAELNVSPFEKQLYSWRCHDGLR